MKFNINANENERLCSRHRRYHPVSEFSINEKTGECYTRCHASQVYDKKRQHVERSNEYKKRRNEQKSECSFRLKTATWAAYFDGKHECQYVGEIHPHTNGKEFELTLLEMHHKNGDGTEHKVSLGIAGGSRAAST